MLLTIITINYNGSENTIKLLKSLQEQIDPSIGLGANQDFQIIVVDNASGEADFKTLFEFVNGTTSQVVLLRNGENLGFSGGNNVGIRKAIEMETDLVKSPPGNNEAPREASGQASWVILLNNDTWVEKDFIACLKAELSELSGIVGVPLLEGDRMAYYGKIEWLKPTLRHVYENPKSEILNLKAKVPTEKLLRELPPKQIQNSKFQTQNILNFDSYNPNFYIIGGAMAIHRDVFEKIGLLDKKYFLYFEDADFSLRAKKINIPISIAKSVMIHHNTSSSTKKLGSALLLRYHYRNALYFNLKNGPWRIKLLGWPWSWIIILKQILKVMIYHNREESLAILKGVFDFYRNRMGKIKAGENTGK